MISDKPKSELDILIVDDDIAHLKLLSRVVERDGYRVLCASGGDAAFKLINQKKPDLIFLDVQMPDMNGFEICERLKSNPETENIPVLYISGHTENIDITTAFKSGGVDYIKKPFKIDEVLARIEAHLKIMVAQNRMVEKVQSGESRLEHNEQKLASIVQTFNGFIYTVDQNRQITYVNQAFKRYLKKSSVGAKCYKAIFNLESPCSWCPRLTDFQDGVLVQKEVLNSFDNRWYQIVFSPIFDKKKEIVERQMILMDISERKKELIELQEREGHLLRENSILRQSMLERFKFGEIVGKSETMQRVYELIIKSAGSDANVIIYGDSGTGKELVAKEIHKNSDRKDQAMVYVNCGAIPENLIESEFFGYMKGAFTGATSDRQGYLSQADQGVLFLDEIGDISLTMQVKLLRAIEGGGYTPVGGTVLQKPDIRIIAATNKNLMDEVKKGNIRSDFFYRIHIIPIRLPALCERREDIGLLIDHFWDQMGDEAVGVLSSSVRDSLINYDWPGNVRELQNTLKRLATVDKLDFVHEMPPPENRDYFDSLGMGSSKLSLGEAVGKLEKRMIKETLESCNWKKVETATKLKIDRKTLSKKIVLYDIKESQI